MPDQRRVAVANTSPLMYLHQCGLIDLLPKLYPEVLVPPAVVQELANGRALGFDLPDPTAYRWVRVVRPPMCGASVLMRWQRPDVRCQCLDEVATTARVQGGPDDARVNAKAHSKGRWKRRFSLPQRRHGFHAGNCAADWNSGMAAPRSTPLGATGPARPAVRVQRVLTCTAARVETPNRGTDW
jgi:hypothetical protein